jgi:hypothetical protein
MNQVIHVDVWSGKPGKPQQLVKSYTFDDWQKALPVIQRAADVGYLVYVVNNFTE